MKIIYSKIFYNEIKANENFPDYGIGYIHFEYSTWLYAYMVNFTDA